MTLRLALCPEAERGVFKLLAAPLTNNQRVALDKLLEVTPVISV
ncbi:hypothetical protein [Nitrosospira multiformis]|nr:hypothetical protein [Nitrosospira multiformis]